MLRERAIHLAGQGDNLDALALDGLEQGNQFIGGAGIAYGEQDIVIADDPEVAVHGLDGVHGNGGGAGTGEGGGHLVADMPVLADTGHDDLAAVFHGGQDGIDGLDEAFAHFAFHLFDPGNLVV